MEAAEDVDGSLPIELYKLLQPDHQDMEDVIVAEQVLEAGEVEMGDHRVDEVECFDSVFLDRNRGTVLVCWSSSMIMLKTWCS